MDFSPIKKSFKSHGSYKHTRKLSSGGGGGGRPDSTDSINHEELPILCRHYHSHQSDNDSQEILQDTPMRTFDSNDRAEVIVKVDAGGGRRDSSSESSANSSNGSGKIQRELTFDFTQDGKNRSMEDDPPSRLIGKFLKQQKTTGGEIALDIDLEMDELRRESLDKNLPHSFPESPQHKLASRVSFEPSISGGIDNATESVRRRYKECLEGDHDEYHYQQPRRDEVLKCTSNASFRKQSTLLTRLKTKSRLIDPPLEEMQIVSGRIGKSGQQMKSGMLSRVMDDEDDDDLLDVEDLPEKYKRAKVNTLTVLQWVGLIAIMMALVWTLSIPHLKRKSFLGLGLWRWEVLLLVLICGRLVSGWGIRIIVFFIERNFLLRKRVLYFVYGLRSGVQNCWWLGLVLLAWHFLFDKKVQRETHSNFLNYVTKILVCFLVANFIWLIKTLMVKVLALSFHVSTYFDRIQESLFNQFVIETLSGPPLIEMQRNEEEMERTAAEVRKLQNAGATMPPGLKAAVFPPAKSGRVLASGRIQKSFKGKSFKASGQLPKKGDKKGDDEITIDHLHKLNPKNVSAWNMKRLMNIVRNGSLSTLDEQIIGTTTEDESTTQIRSEYEAKAAARKIFYNVARRGSKYIYLEDLMRFMREDEALKTMSFFDGAFETKKIGKSPLKNWVVNAFRERRALALTLNDTKTAVNKLHQMVNIIVGIIVVIILLVILGIATSKFFVVLGSQIVVVSFMFGNTAKTLFESVIFLFIIHPFDVGDRCEVDGVQLIVEEMNILTTIFLRSDNQKVVYPNSVLGAKSIGNYYRSPDMGDSVEFFIHISTPVEKVAFLKQRIISYIGGKKEHWYPNPTVILKEMEDLNKLRIAVWLRHRINHQDMGEKWERRALLLEEMAKIFKELDIQYHFDVHIHAMSPSKSCCPP